MYIRNCREQKEQQIATKTRLPVYGEGLARWLLFGHTDDTWRASVRTAQPRAAHTIGPAAHPNTLTDLRVV